MVIRSTLTGWQPHDFSEDDLRRMATAGVHPSDPPRFTVAEYERLIDTGVLGESDRVVLIRGEVVEKMSIGSLHADTVNGLAEVFVLHFHAVARTSSQNPIILADSEPEPDGMLLVRRPGGYARQKPTPADVFLVVEVADSSLSNDLGTQAELYAENGIPEYWVVDLVHDRVHVHTGPQPDGTWARISVHGRGETLTVVALAGITVGVDELLP